jgi:pentatricopeptide repeat protein
MALYDEMRSRGIACNNIAYNTMLNAFAHCGAMHRVPQLLEDMKCADPPVEPDVVTFSTIVKGYCASGNLDKGLHLLQEMRKGDKLAHDEVMYNSLLDGCARERRGDEALRLLDDMHDSGVAPSNCTLSILVRLLGRTRRLPQAFAMVETLCSEHGIRANIQVYTCLMQACFHNRQPGKALALHDRIVREGCNPDRKAYGVLVEGCVRAGNVNKAAEVVRCAYHLPGHNLIATRGSPVGVSDKDLRAVLSRLGVDTAAARQLSADVKACASQHGRDECRPMPRLARSARSGARGW